MTLHSVARIKTELVVLAGKFDYSSFVEPTK
jgi:hypothetical protein